MAGNESAQQKIQRLESTVDGLADEMRRLCQALERSTGKPVRTDAGSDAVIALLREQLAALREENRELRAELRERGSGVRQVSDTLADLRQAGLIPEGGRGEETEDDDEDMAGLLESLGVSPAKLLASIVRGQQTHNQSRSDGGSGSDSGGAD